MVELVLVCRLLLRIPVCYLICVWHMLRPGYWFWYIVYAIYALLLWACLTVQQLPHTHITKQFTSRSPTDKNTKHTQVSLDFFRSNVSLFHILDIMNILEIILRNCFITDDIHIGSHTA